jgi:AmmeMemoRadiSam system protein A
MSPLPEDARRRLLDLARESIVSAVVGREVPHVPPADSVLAAPAGAFVTLRIAGRLRGCIGRLDSTQPLADSIACSAANAAVHDPRFRPVAVEEIPEISIEISVLSPPAPIRREEIEIGRHGLIVSRGAARGVLLPQVALERSWDAAYFLGETCVKAGLGRDAWRDPATVIEGFTAEVFSEGEFARSTATGRSPDYSSSA